MRLAIHGVTGRMGQAVTRIAASEGVSIVGAIASPGSAGLGATPARSRAPARSA